MFSPTKFLDAKIYLKSKKVLRKSNLQQNVVITKIKYFSTLFKVRLQILYSRYMINHLGCKSKGRLNTTKHNNKDHELATKVGFSTKEGMFR